MSKKLNADDLIQDIEIALGQVIQTEVWGDFEKPLSEEHLAEIRAMQANLEGILAERETTKNAPRFVLFPSA